MFEKRNRIQVEKEAQIFQREKRCEYNKQVKDDILHHENYLQRGLQIKEMILATLHFSEDLLS